MKKIFLIAVVLLMMINLIINYHHEVTKEQHTPIADFKTKVEMAPMKEYNDPDFGYVVKYPCFFQQEDTSVSGIPGLCPLLIYQSCQHHPGELRYPQL